MECKDHTVRNVVITALNFGFSGFSIAVRATVGGRVAKFTDRRPGSCRPIPTFLEPIAAP
jgi:hypothetical protein